MECFLHEGTGWGLFLQESYPGTLHMSWLLHGMLLTCGRGVFPAWGDWVGFVFVGELSWHVTHVVVIAWSAFWRVKGSVFRIRGVGVFFVFCLQELS